MPAVAVLVVQLFYVVLCLFVQLIVALARVGLLLVLRQKRRKSQAKADAEPRHDR